MLLEAIIELDTLLNEDNALIETIPSKKDKIK